MRNTSWYRLRIGGVLRCCSASLGETEIQEAPREGEVLACKYCKGALVYRDGAWEWNQAPEWNGEGARLDASPKLA